MKNKKKLIIIIAIAVIALIVIINPKPQKQATPVANTGAMDTATLVPVEADTISKGNIERTVFTIGTVDPVEIFNVNAKVTGEVTEANYEVGDHVEKGDVLFVIDKSTFEINKNANLNQLKNSVDQTKRSLDQAQEDYDKQVKLFETGASSQQELDSMKTALENAQTAYNNALTNYNSNSSTYNEQLDDYVQKSPVSGIIVEKNINKDIFASTQNGYSIISEDAYVVNATISSKYVKSVHKGQKASIYVNTLDRSYEGEVLSVSSVGQNGSYAIEISIEGDDQLMSGLYSEIEIAVESVENTLLISKKALIYEGDDVFVYEIQDDGAVKKIQIQVGIVNSEHIQVLDGISEGVKVVTVGKNYVVDGAKVKIKE